MEKERTKALVIVVLLIVVAGLTVAFASLSSVLNIKGTAYLDAAKWGIKFENLSEPVKVGTATTTGTAKIEETKSAEINGINVSLSTPGDKVVYTVDLVNEGTINTKIDKIEKTQLTSEQQRYLTFKVTDKEGKEVSEGDILSAGETRNLTITIEFIKDLTKEDLPTNTSTISLSYKWNFVQTDEKKDTTTPSEVQNELPSGYKKVEYLESTGTQYIITDFVPQIGDSIEFYFKRNRVLNFVCPISSRYSKNHNIQLILLLGDEYSYFKYFTDGAATRMAQSFSYDDMQKIEILNDGTINIAGNKFTDEVEKQKTIIDGNLYLFERSDGSSKFVGAIGEINFKRNYKKVLNLIPCLDSDNKPCMYDTVSKKTFYNNGTGEFLYGNEID